MKQQTIQAQVNKRLLSKADRLFTGTLEGRIIEILQNARRAGATEVTITQNDGLVTIQDNGSGIQDFQTLLDLGGSGWTDKTERSEDPAGVGIFSLAPRDVTIESGRTKLVVTQSIWTGQPAQLFELPEAVQGTRLQFQDQPWEMNTVEKYAVFTGLDVTVNGKSCAKKRFCSRQSTCYPHLGCRIEVRRRDHLSAWHKAFQTNYYHHDVLVNFYGQVVPFDYEPISGEHLVFLVDLTGETTALRLMLPARTRMVENEAFRQLKDILEKEAYRFIHKQGRHALSYDNYLRARQLGIDLPESDPVFTEGLLANGECSQPMQVVKPKEFPLSRCYKAGDHPDELEIENAHILAAAGSFKAKNLFVPVDIRPAYEGYSWAKLPTVGKVTVTLGKKLGSGWIQSETVEAYESIEIAVLTSDGRRFESAVPMAVIEVKSSSCSWLEKTLCLTPAARTDLSAEEIWYHLGGYQDDGDTYDTQLSLFEENLNRFWAEITGPEEFLRDKLLTVISDLISPWKQLTIDVNGTMTILLEDGTQKSYSPAKMLRQK